MKITNIDIKINTQKFPKDKLTWISLHKKLIYISWTTGRSYWALNKEHKEIKNMKYDDDKQTIAWTYEGMWENIYTGEGKVRTKNFKIIFHNEKDYKKVKKALFP